MSMVSLESLNEIIEQKFVSNDINDEEVLKQLLATAEELYKNTRSISTKHAAAGYTLPTAVIVLGQNIERLKEALAKGKSL